MILKYVVCLENMTQFKIYVPIKNTFVVYKIYFKITKSVKIKPNF